MCEYYDAVDLPAGTHATMFFDGRYKSIVYHGLNLGELYDLQTDPWELQNLAEEAGRRVLCAELGDRLDRDLARTKDKILDGFVPNKLGKPDVPLWERQADGSYRLRAYDRIEGSDVPFGEPLIES